MKSLKEKAVLVALGILLMYAFAVGFWFLHAQNSWRRAQKKYENAKETYQRECALIAKKNQYEEEYESAKAHMPVFDVNKSTDTVWLKKIDELAERHNVVISTRKAESEVEAGEVTELPVSVTGCECSLQGLVKFMHELENTDEGMFDIKALNFKPNTKTGYLRGTFTVTCAYTRKFGDEE